MRSSESVQGERAGRAVVHGGQRVGAWLLFLLVLGLGGGVAWWAMPSALDESAMAPVEVTTDAARTEDVASPTSVGGLSRAMTPSTKADRTAATVAPLPVWPGDVDEPRPDPPGDGPLTVTVIDLGGQLVRGAQVQLAAETSAPMLWRARPEDRTTPTESGTEPGRYGVTDRYGRCRVTAVAGQRLLATDPERRSGIAAVGPDAVARGRMDLIVRPGLGLEAVVIGFDGKGVANAVVTATALDVGRTFVGNADAKGVCRWLLDGDCRYDISARDADRLSETIRLLGGVGEAPTVRVRLLGVAVIEGRVLDPHGAPMPNASVRVMTDFMSSNDPLGARREFGAASGDDGAFRAPLPGPGRYRLVAQHADFGPSAAEMLEVAVGKATQATLRLVMPGEFQGVVCWKDGPPIAGASLRFTTADRGAMFGRGEVAFETATAADGSYRIERVPADASYVAICVPDPTRPQVRMERPGLRPSPQHFVFDQAAVMGASFGLEVSTEDGTALREVVTRLRRRNEYGHWQPGGDETLPVVAGCAQVGRLTPGATYAIDVSAPGFGRMRSDAFVAGTTPTVGISLPRACVLEVRVVVNRDEVGVDAEVVLQEDLPQGVTRGARADAWGRVAFADLPPGAFTVHVRRGADRPVRERVELSAGRKHRVEVRLRR